MGCCKLQMWEYYEKALAQFPDDIPVRFSDVIEWCQEQEFFKHRFIMSEI